MALLSDCNEEFELKSITDFVFIYFLTVINKYINSQ